MESAIHTINVRPYVQKRLVISEADQSQGFRKYQNSNLKPGEREIILERLNTLISQQVYLDADLTLPKLADHIKVSTHLLSQVINSTMQMNFNSYINMHRVKYASKLLSEATTCPKISWFAYQVGFNNKISFYHAFKNLTGYTPVQYFRRSTLVVN